MKQLSLQFRKSLTFTFYRFASISNSSEETKPAISEIDTKAPTKGIFDIF